VFWHPNDDLFRQSGPISWLRSPGHVADISSVSSMLSSV
jgi:hypothetical protein